MTKLIHLTMDKVALVDDEDYDLVNQFPWHAEKSRHNWYARSYLSQGRYAPRIGLHNFLMKPTDGMEVDHIDRDGLNCQRSNLRLCTHIQNTRNRTFANASGYRGVYPAKTPDRYYATIRADGGTVHLGTFGDVKEAALAYNEAARRYHGEFAVLNILE